MAGMGPGAEGWGGGWGWGLGVGEAKPGAEPISTGREPEPGHCTVKQGNPPSLLSAARVLVPSDLELITCLSPAVLPSSLLTSSQTACDGWVLWVATPLSVDCMETDGKSQTSLTARPHSVSAGLEDARPCGAEVRHRL